MDNHADHTTQQMQLHLSLGRGEPMSLADRAEARIWPDDRLAGVNQQTPVA